MAFAKATHGIANLSQPEFSEIKRSDFFSKVSPSRGMTVYAPALDQKTSASATPASIVNA